MTATAAAVTVTQEGPVTVVHLDDGKANALTHEILDALRATLRSAAGESQALVIAGRPGRFSGGFDLAVMTAGPDAAMPLLQAGAEFAIEVYTSPIPVVLACTGHAVAMGAILLMAADTRIGAAGDFKIGMNEVAIGMPVPRFATELARDRLTPPAFVPAIQHAHLFDPEGAVGAGFLDRVVAPDEVVATAVATATGYAENLRSGAFQLTREIARGGPAHDLRAALVEDLAPPHG